MSRKSPLVVAVLALIAALALGMPADAAKKKGKKKPKGSAPTALSSVQSEILSAGAIKVRGGTRSVFVRAVVGGKPGPALTTTGKASKGESSLALTTEGRTLLRGCTVEALRAESTFKKTTKGKKKGKGKAKKRKKNVTLASQTPLTKNLGVCSVGSENPVSTPYIGDPIDTTNADRCDFMDPAVCLQPWPNDYFTVADATTDTGRRLNLNAASTPKNKNGVGIDPTDWNRADGFSPGNPIIVKVPEVQTKAAFANSGLVPISDLRRYADANQPAVVINTDTGQRQPIWVEVDVNPLEPDASGNVANSNIIIRAARNFEEGGHYVVALRNLRNEANQPVEPPIGFRVYRDRLITNQAAVESRRAKMEQNIQALQAAGIPRANLYLAWDFTVASEESLSGRALAIRDDAMEELGDTNLGDGIAQGSAPTFAIDNVQQFTPAQDANTFRRIDGRLTNVPCYLTTLPNPSGPCGPGTQFDHLPNGDITWDENSSYDVPFRCIIPQSAVAGGTVQPAKPGTYGHGLLGEFEQVNGQARLANQNNSIWCAVDWQGFSADDLGTVLQTLANTSNFVKLADRMQQGFVNFHYLGRALIRPGGFDSDPAFQFDPGGGPVSLIDQTELYYEGISQGGIMGGALTATSPDIRRSVLNVTGMNYSTLLRRSVDSDEYFKLSGLGLYANYPNELERPLLLSMMQLLWDRGEANGYAHHLTDDPLPNTPSHEVLLQVATGDHQVSNVTAEVKARTAGVPVYAPLEPGRHWEANPFMDLTPISFGTGPAFTPHTGSALVYYDGGPTSYFNNGSTPQAALECSRGNPATDPCQGSGVMPTDELPPREENGYGDDPHGYPRRSVDALQHVEDFLQPNGTGFILPCADGATIRPCYANGWQGF